MTVEMALAGSVIGAAMGTLAYVIVQLWRQPMPPPARKYHWLKDAMEEIEVLDEVNHGTK